VKATIADRCQRFDFQRPSLEQISEVLVRVASAEGIEVEDGAVATVARSASGSFRDALGTLDQLVAFGGNQVGLDDVLQLLGAADAELLFGAVDAVIAEDPKAVLLGVEEMARSGRDPSQFARDLLAHLRHLLVTQTVGEVPNTFVVTATDQGRLAAQAQAIGAATLVRTIDELAQALTAVREGDDARMAVEIALLKAARPDLDPSTEGLLRRIERLEQGTEAPQAAGPVTAGDPPPLPVAKASSGGVPPTVPPAAEASSSDEQPSASPDTPGPVTGPAGQVDLDQMVKTWPSVLDQLLQTAPALAATFEGARPVGVDASKGSVTIGFPADHTFNKRKAEAPDKREQMAAALEAVLGEKLRPMYSVLEGEEAGSASEGGEDAVDHAARVEKIKSEFDAEEVG
jgi:DNA polymerase III subunit gamma/tau